MTELSVEQNDARLRATFFRSVTIVVSAAALILAGSEGTLFPAALTPAIAVFAWIFVDHFRWVRIPVLIGNLFGLLALFVAVDEFVGGTVERKLLSGAHLVVYLSWIVLLLPKSHRQYWWLIALSLLHLAIAGILSSGIGFGGAMLCMLMLLLWTVSLFSLFRAQDLHVSTTREAIAFEKPATLSVNALDSPDLQSHTVRLTNGTPIESGWLRPFLHSFLGTGIFFARRKPALRPRPDAVLRNRILFRNGLQRDSAETWVGWRFRGMVAGMYVFALILALVVFAAFPRVWIPESMLFGDLAREAGAAGNRTGFSESVELGDIGRIMQSNARVLSFDVIDVTTQTPVTADALAEAIGMDDLRFRGNVLAVYTEGRWLPGFQEKGFYRGEEMHRVGAYLTLPGDFRMTIVQDLFAGVYAFAPFPLSRVNPEGGHQLVSAEVRGSLVWIGRAFTEGSRKYIVDLPRSTPDRPMTFEYWSDPPAATPSEVEQRKSERAAFAEGLYLMNGHVGPAFSVIDGQRIPLRRRYENTNDLKVTLPRLCEIAKTLCQGDGTLVPPAERTERIVRYLSSDNGFRYSLEPSRSDRSLDPLEDFLINTRSGHCEYFASACTLMLQAVDVPARLVNGFYGSEFNAVTGKYEVRQRHAHAWCEAFIDDRWQTVEATPGDDRRLELTAKRSTTLISNLQTALTDFWNDGIHQMSAERQKEFFAPVLSTSRSFFQKIREQGLLLTIRTGISNFIHSPEKWVSWQGGAVTFIFLLIAAGMAKVQLFQRIARFVRGLLRSRSLQQRSIKSVIRFYEGFCFACERHGLQLPATNSALENAYAAIQRFGSRLDAPDLRLVPERIATTFNEVRFGNRPLSDSEAAAIGRELHRFAEALKSQAPVRSTPLMSHFRKDDGSK